MMQFNPMCINCNRKNRLNSYYNKLYRLSQLLQHNKIEAVDKPAHYGWSLPFRCNYGFNCPSLTSKKTQCEYLTFELNKLLPAVANSNNESLCHEVLELLRGEFPNIYTQFERDHIMFNRKEKSDEHN